MRLRPQELERHLSQTLAPLYVLMGDEPLAQRESLDAIRAAARAAGHDERTRLTVERHFNWQQITAFGQSISLFASRRILEINIPSGKPGVDGSKALLALAEQPIPDTVTIVILPKLERDAKNSAWFAALENHGISLTLSEITPAALPQWIATRLAQQGQHTDKETLEFIAHQVEGNLLAAHQEIQKLGLLYAEGTLDGNNVREAVLNVSRYDAFQLGDAVLSGDTEHAVRILHGLRDEGAQPVAIMSALAWVLRGLVKVKYAETQGSNLNSAMQQARIYGDRQNLVKRALNRLSMRHLEAALQKLAEIDKAAKGLLNQDPWLEISRLCFGLARLGNRK
ncbi:DNA polymerase III, delta subunit [Methylobacillus rhizosphaerae]|uniref:DNA polymerase III subunit delta n=1 Tax=Methylobacillus rhizosphaerae TaxID=551994 RepID=A0A238Y3E8_9PROT|nr:DNA polymerase III subunit delta [Methylobacillus rhizosphaerae]SNR65348.1 DNA polymerase III, delta subunit [Methylobacillus rhizosphaerae]